MYSGERSNNRYAQSQRSYFEHVVDEINEGPEEEAGAVGGEVLYSFIGEPVGDMEIPSLSTSFHGQKLKQ